MIQKISVSNYKSLKNIEVELPQYAIIIGHNGAGKTNLLTLIKLISLLAKGKQINDALKNLNLWSNEIFFDQSKPVIEINLELLIKTSSVIYNITLSKLDVNSDLKITKELLKINGQEVLHRENGSPVTILENGMSTTTSPIVNNQLAISVLTVKEIIEVKDCLSSIIVEQFEPSVLKSYGKPDKDSNSLNSVLAEKLYFLKNSEPETFKELQYIFKKIIPTFESVDVEMYPNEGLLLMFKEKNLKNVYRSFSASNGNLRAMGIISALYGKPKISSIFIDEIENSLHPSRIKTVMSSLQYVASDENNKIQVVLTTHNPILLDYVTVEQIIYCYNKEGITHLINPYKNKKVKTYLQQSQEKGVSLKDMFSTGLLEEMFTT